MPSFNLVPIRSWLASGFRIKSIRGQLTFGLIAAIGPCLAIGFIAIREVARSRIYSFTERRLQAEGQLISYGLEQWGAGLRDVVDVLSHTSPFIKADVKEINTVFAALSVDNPTRLWRFWSASQSPRILAYTGTLSAANKADAEARQASRAYYQAALRGFSTYEVVVSRTTSRACLNVSQPVFDNPYTNSRLINGKKYSTATAKLLEEPLRNDVAGVIVSCLPLATLGEDTGLSKLFDNERLRLLASDNKRGFLSDPAGFESLVMLVSNNGQLLFPDLDWSDRDIPNIQQLLKSNIPALYPIAQKAMHGEDLFAVVPARNNSYFALTARVDSAWSLVLLLNQRSALKDVEYMGYVLGFVGLSTLLLLAIVVALRSRSLSRPLSVAAEALGEISQGRFDVQLPPPTDDEIGGLLANIQITADRLKNYVHEALTFAVTEKQLETAKSIQSDFLLSSLPLSPCYDVKAFSRPALQIGADWYDMVDTGDYVFLVVADVCDKGVPSALYMSVFRSLIRSKILDSFADDQAPPEASTVIQNAIEHTNDYMASNQNSSMMFATAFIAAVHKTTGLTNCICAGHEPPVLLSNGVPRMLETVSGPAIGLFEGATYSPFVIDLQRCDTLVIYSDGLVDARNPANEGWGKNRLTELLASTPVESAELLMQTMIKRVDSYMAGEDQFDDLTVMIFRRLGD